MIDEHEVLKILREKYRLKRELKEIPKKRQKLIYDIKRLSNKNIAKQLGTSTRQIDMICDKWRDTIK